MVRVISYCLLLLIESINRHARKRSVIMSVVDRALKIFCSTDTLDYEYETLTKVLSDNGYSLRIIKQMTGHRNRHRHHYMLQQNHPASANNSSTGPQPNTNNINSQL